MFRCSSSGFPTSRLIRRATHFSLLAVALLLRQASSAAAQAAAHDHASMPMTDAAMESWVKGWYRIHPMRGEVSTGVPVATFNASGFSFDLDNDPGTVIDTAKIMVGETVRWHRLSGSHTTTNGLGFEDPNAGLLWDRAITLAAPDFQFTFDTPGEYPFFCRPHESNGMKGVVLVLTPVGVEPGGGAHLGFTSGPHPNPSRLGVTFAFALVHPGRVTAEVFDARGRRVAVPLDRDFGPGEQSASWDGRVNGGARAVSGIYYLRLRLPGYAATRQISITR